MRRPSLRRAAALLPVAALGLATVAIPGPAGAAPPGDVNVGDVTIVEGSGGTYNNMKFPITLSEPVGTDVIVQWTIEANTATAGTDYVALKKPKTTKIRAGKTAAFATVKDIPDAVAEGDENFTVVLQSIVSGDGELGDKTVGLGTILDDDGVAGTTVSVGDASAVETDSGQPKIALPFTLSAPLPTSEVHVTWTLTGDTATGGTALDGSDFKALTKPKVTKIKAGKTNVQGTITAYGDTTYEGDETFTVQITGISVVGTPAAVSVNRATGTGTILEDDPVPTPPDTPTGVSATLQPGDAVLVDWDAALTGTPADGFAVEVTDDGGANWSLLGTTGAGTTDFTTDPLAPGTYQFRVYAQNGAGNSGYGGPSNEVTIEAPEAPGAPTNVAAAYNAGLNVVEVSWDAPSSGDAPTGYNYEYSPDDGTTWINLGSGGTATSFSLEMPPGDFIFRIQAENAGGPGPWSDPSNEVSVPVPPCDPFCSG